MQEQKQTPPDNLRSDVKEERVITDLDKTKHQPSTRRVSSSGGVLPSTRRATRLPAPALCAMTGKISH